MDDDETTAIELVEIEHVQLGMPPGGGDATAAAARRLYGEVLGFAEVAPPAPLRGLWFRAGRVELHLHEEEGGFRPVARAHPGMRVARGLDALAARCEAAGHAVRFDRRYPGRRRFYVADPFGNELEFLQLEPDVAARAD
jgi:catechol 2,3-dioxygenase-like lactoylglutathione lyase family enzyme